MCACPTGRTATREYVVHPGAVAIVPLLDDGRVVLERQFRYPVGRVMLEIPAGKIDVGEPPLLCAKRELLEETGYVAARVGLRRAWCTTPQPIPPRASRSGSRAV